MDMLNIWDMFNGYNSDYNDDHKWIVTLVITHGIL